MRLKKLEIYGFKSFADRTVMTFEDGITGVVGPNGCGKSNIADAVRWVLGEQSAKTLRGAKMEDIIFNGTEKRRKLSYCEVVLVFDNEDRQLPISYSEVAVARRVYRSGDSEYSINKAQCRLRDVVELFRDTGIGKEGYSLIGQGRIDEILSVKSEDRRQIFEEAAGIVKYKARKTEAERRIDNTRLNLSRVEDIIGELSMRMEPLRQQADDAREYLQLQGELKQLELNVFLVRSQRYQERLNELAASLAELHSSLEQSEAELLKLTQEREVSQESLSLLEAQAASARERVQDMIRLVESRDGQVGVLNERIAALERDRERLASDLRAAEDGEGGVDRQIGLLKGKIEFETSAIAGARATLGEGEKRLNESESNLFEREAKIERLKGELIESMNQLSDVKSEQARLEAMRDALQSRIMSLKDEQQLSGDEGGGLEARCGDALERYNLELAEKAALESEVQLSVERVRELGERGDELKEAVQRLTGKKQELSSRLRVLMEMQRDYEGYQHSVKNVLIQSRRQQNSGVLGVVANLLNVPLELERAVDMVLGGSLQHIVVEREEDAKRMIDYLRNNRLGRATFLPLTSVRGRTLDHNERRVLQMDGCVGLASELVKFDARYQGVIDNLLGRTVVAKDLHAGIEIMRSGRHMFRLVTLDGDVMHSGGSMTGGSVQSRVTSLLSREREVQEHTLALKETTEALEAAEFEFGQLDVERGELKRIRAELYDKLHQQEIACTRAEAHVRSAETELIQHNERTQRAEGAQGQLNEQLEDVESSLGQLTGRQSEDQRHTDDTQREIAELQRGLLDIRSETVKLRESVQAKRVALAAQERGLESLISDHSRLEGQRTDIARLLVDNSALLVNCDVKLERDRSELSDAAEALRRDKQALGDERARFQAIDEKRTGIQRRLRELSEAESALRERIDGINDRCHRSEMQQTKVESEYKQLTDRIWEDYELSFEGAEQFRDLEFKLTESEKRIAQIKQRIRQMGSVNVAAVEEYRQTGARYQELTEQRDDLLKAELDLQGIIDELVKKMERQFKSQFEILNANFQETFVKLFAGGRAELQLTDPKDALGSGIEIVAQPPGKKLQLLSLLSGGERALTAIAILFAMLLLKPTPFCFLDEIEAALDDANIDHYAEFLKVFSKKTQFVVVTHRKGTMERCDALYGVAMEEKGVSRMVSVRLSEAEKIVM